MPALREKGITLLGTLASVNMQAAASTTLFTTPIGKVTRITHVVIRDPSASLAGGTSYSFTNWRSAVDLSALTTANTGFLVLDSNNSPMTELAGGIAFQITVTTGATAAATATIDVFGYVTT